MTSMKISQQVGPFDEFHNEIGLSLIGFTKIKNGDDVRVTQLGHGFGFLRKPIGKTVFIIHHFWEHFYCYQTIQFRLQRLVNGTHAANSKQLNELILRQTNIEFFN